MFNMEKDDSWYSKHTIQEKEASGQMSKIEKLVFLHYSSTKRGPRS